MEYVDFVSVIAINQRFSEQGIRDETALRSAVYQCQQGAFGQDFHVTLEEKAAVLMRGLSRNHAFVDGNKRTALAASDAFLRLNGVRFKAGQDELVSFVLEVAQGMLEVDEITKRIAHMIVPLERNHDNGIERQLEDNPDS